MIFRRIGDTGLECSIIGLGSGRLASVSGGLSRADARRLLDDASDLGVNLIDTADSYAQGECEKILGQALAGRRDKFIVTTKAGYCFTALGGGLRLLKPLAKRAFKYLKRGSNLAGNVRSNISRQDFSTSAITNAVTASLQRLRTDYVDIFLLHSPPLAVMSDAGLFETLRGWKQAGKIRNFGVSSPDPAVLETAMRINGLSVVQTPVNPAQSINNIILSKLAAAKIGVMANQIFLSGKLLHSADANEMVAFKRRLEALAKTKGISVQRLLINYALLQPSVVSALTGTVDPAHLKQNVADALAECALTSEDFLPVMHSEIAHKSAA